MAERILIPHELGYHGASGFMLANGEYYFFISDHTTHANNLIQDLEQTNATLRNARRNMIQGKRIANTDMALMIRYIPYQSNKAFDMYDDILDLTERDFYCVVNASSWFHVFKCLDNNFGANSTVEPNFADISGANTDFYRTSDGYVWKYMYSASSAQVAKFGTSTRFPVVPNTVVTEQALAGSIDVIKIENKGLRYNNYLTGTFSVLDVRVTNNTTYRLTNSVASSVNGFYTGCSFYISAGAGAGQFATVVDYITTEGGNYAVIDEPFEINPTNGSEYEIYPGVVITGSGSETIPAVARALVNSVAGNAIYRIEMFERGAHYDYAIANVVANAVVGVTQVANVRPIYPPTYGHGYNAALELLSKEAEVSILLSNSESNTILTSNRFQQIGIIKNPLFANVQLNIVNTSGAFLAGEKLLSIRPLRITDNVVTNTTSSTIIDASGKFSKHLTIGDYVYITNTAVTLSQLGIVSGILNTTAFTISVNSFVSTPNATIWTAQPLATAYVDTFLSATQLLVTNVTAEIVGNDFIIGVSTGSTATVNTIQRNAVTKGFETFIQLYKYKGELTFNNFVANELISQNTSANGLLHTATVTGGNVVLYTSNQVGVFDINSEVTGNTSGALAIIQEVFLPELVFDTGEIIYLENIEAVFRQPNQTERFKILFAY